MKYLYLAIVILLSIAVWFYVRQESPKEDKQGVLYTNLDSVSGLERAYNCYE